MRSLCASLVLVAALASGSAEVEDMQGADVTPIPARTLYTLRDPSGGKYRQALKAAGHKWDHADGNDDSLIEFQGGPEHKLLLQSLGLELIQEQTSAFEQGFAQAGYHTPAQIKAKWDALQAANPTIAKVGSMTRDTGKSKTRGGREIYYIKLSDNVATDEDEPNFLLVTCHHARELVTPETALNAAQQLVAKYKAGEAKAKKILDENQVYIVFTMNPDGLHSVWGGNTWQRANSNGVDLNRNYPIGWAPGHPKNYRGGCEGDSTPGSESYRGSKPLSEIETSTMAKWQSERKFAKVMDVHSYGRNVRINYGCHPLPSAVHNHQAALGTIVAKKMGYPQGQSCCMGGDIHNAYNQHGSLSFLVELGGDSFQPGSATRASVVRETWPGMYEFLALPTSASGHVYSGSSATAKGNPVSQATYKVTSVPCTTSGCTSTFTLGEKASTSTRGRYHLWLPAGTYSVAFTTGGTTKTVQVTTSDAGNVQDIYLGLSASTLREEKIDEQARTEQAMRAAAAEADDTSDDRSESGESREDRRNAEGMLKHRHSPYGSKKLGDSGHPAQPSVLELACEQGLLKCDEAKQAAMGQANRAMAEASRAEGA